MEGREKKRNTTKQKTKQTKSPPCFLARAVKNFAFSSLLMCKLCVSQTKMVFMFMATEMQKKMAEDERTGSYIHAAVKAAPDALWEKPFLLAALVSQTLLLCLS